MKKVTQFSTFLFLYTSCVKLITPIFKFSQIFTPQGVRKLPRFQLFSCFLYLGAEKGYINSNILKELNVSMSLTIPRESYKLAAILTFLKILNVSSFYTPDCKKSFQFSAFLKNVNHAFFYTPTCTNITTIPPFLKHWKFSHFLHPV